MEEDKIVENIIYGQWIHIDVTSMEGFGWDIKKQG